jgi:hypothetical protein
MTEFELEIKQGDVTVRASAVSPSELSKHLKDVATLLAEAKRELVSNHTTATKRAELTSESQQMNDVPSIVGVNTCRDAIIKLSSTPWGRTPRSQGEFRTAMEMSAIYYSQPVVAKELQRMTKAGLLRRLKKDNQYVYVLPNPAIADSKTE